MSASFPAALSSAGAGGVLGFLDERYRELQAERAAEIQEESREELFQLGRADIEAEEVPMTDIDLDKTLKPAPQCEPRTGHRTARGAVRAGPAAAEGADA